MKRIFLTILLLNFCGFLLAEETDQFTLPPSELQDFGPLASRSLYALIERTRIRTNAKIKLILAKSKNRKLAASELEPYLNGNYIANYLHRETGSGYPVWLRQPYLSREIPRVQYRELLPWKTIYWLVFAPFPISLLELAPTMRMYDYYLGADKINHFFMEGYSYYKIYIRQLAQEKTPDEAHAAMINFGQFTEETIYGGLVSGVYSNGDLSANYAGWKFYMNLTREIKISDHILPPILVLHNMVWEFSPNIDIDNLLLPYLSDNLNEAWNPSFYYFMRPRICRQIKKRCPEWINRVGITPEIVQTKLDETRLWNGEEYGHWLPKNKAITLELCFSNNS